MYTQVNLVIHKLDNMSTSSPSYNHDITLSLYSKKKKPIGVNVCVLQSCLTLCLPGSSVLGILQARILEWLPGPPPGDLPNPGIEPLSLMSPTLTGRFFTTSATWQAP